MKNFLKKNGILLLTIILAVTFLAVFFMFLFNRPGHEVYIIDVKGDVSVGTSNDLNISTKAFPGMKLVESNIILTGKESSCVLSYENNSDMSNNVINVCEETQVNLYSKNAHGGYNFFIAYGSVICCMPTQSDLKTNISTSLCNLYAQDTIAKIDYDSASKSSKVFVFDGNPNLQLIQPSGSMGKIETLLKNSVCAVRDMGNGTVGFGCLNTGFGLDSFSAQDLKIMSGITGYWSERISYSLSDIENAFAAADDRDHYIPTQVTILTTPVETTIGTSSSENTTSIIETTAVLLSETTMTTTQPLTSATVLESTSEKTTAVPSETSTTPRTSVPYITTTPITMRPVTVSTTTSETTTVTTLPPTTIDPDTTYSVIFTYNENGATYWAMQLVKHGQSAVAPNVPKISDRKFVKWDKDYSHVTSDMTINGVFVSVDDECIVSLYVGDTLWQKIKVKKGGDVVLQKLPSVSGKEFVGWSDVLTNVQSDMTAFALFAE